VACFFLSDYAEHSSMLAVLSRFYELVMIIKNINLLEDVVILMFYYLSHC